MARAKPGQFKLRLLSSLVLAPPTLAAAWFGWPWLPALTVVAAAGIGIEWARLAQGGARTRPGALIVATPVAASVVAGFGYASGAVWVALAGSALVLLSLWPLGRRKSAEPALWAGLGTFYMALACLAFLWLTATGGRAVTLWLLALVWAVDIGAYAAGYAIGGPRLAPVLSPNKTWAGFFGGLAAALPAGWAAAVLTDASAWRVVLVSLGLALAAQLGDIGESAAKRHFKVKDSGSLIPGHGGLLDRLDSLLAASLALGLLTLAIGGSPILVAFR